MDDGRANRRENAINRLLLSRHASWEYVTYPIAVVLVMLVVASFTGLWPTNPNPYNSYTLQACAWLQGRLDLGQDYPWLELAITGGKYYVSFPPFPSFVMLPFALFFGDNTPDHMISLAFTVISVVYALKLLRLVTGSLKHAPFYVLFLFLGNGYLFISIQGWVWYLAQCMCFTLSLMALYYAAKGRGGLSLAFWACAVGCRPMVFVYFPLLMALLIRRRKSERGEIAARQWLREKWYWCVPVMLIAAVYMALNAARFGNPLEFGRRYLPEFTQAEQFSLSYVPEHLKQLLRLPAAGGKNGSLIYSQFDCMAYWLIAPMTVSFLIAWLYATACKRKSHDFEIAALPVMLFAHLMIVCCHHTMGSYQFGNRYLVDMMPYVFYGLLSLKPDDERFEQLNIPLFMLGLAVNLLGTVSTYNWS